MNQPTKIIDGKRCSLVKGIDTSADSSGTNDEPGGDFVHEARKLITSGRAKDDGEAFAIMAEERPELYDEYNRNLIKSA